MTSQVTKQPTPPQKFVLPDGSLTFEAVNWFSALLDLLDNAEINLRTTVKQMFEPLLLTAVVQTLFTAPASTNANFVAVVRRAKVRFSNTTAGALTVSAYAVPAGGTAGDTTNAFMVAESIPANTHVDVDVPMLMAGDFVQAKASGNVMCTFLDAVLYS
jgi:hypothetical protein